MKKLNLLFALLLCVGLNAIGQTAYNPFTQNIHFAPEPSVAGFECGTVQNVIFTQGLTTAADATLWATNPLTVTICLGGFTFNGPASSVVSGTYASNFNWAYVIGSPNCIIGTQNQTLPGTGSNPIFPNPLSSGTINLNLKVPENSPVGTVLSVAVTLQVPAYMSLYNSVPDDNESTQTQTFCNCYALTDAGVIAANQSFCVSGDPAPFTSTSAGSGGSGSVIIYQWQELIGSTWTDIVGATASTYDAPTTSVAKQYRRNAKRSACGTWLNSNVVSITINTLPTVNAGVDKNTNCTTTSTSIGTAAIVGNTYAWSPATGLSSTTVAQPTASPTVTTTYTVTVTGSNGCTATDAVLVTVNTTPPTVDAGVDKNLTCTTTSATIGTAAIAGNSYSWSPATALSSTIIAQPTANPTVTTTYTVTVTGSNGCTATDVVVVNVNTTPPTVNAGVDKNLTCSTTSTTIGTASIAGNSYVWSPATGLSSTSIAQPTANPTVTTTYTVTVTGSNGCTASDVVVVNVNTTPPTVDAGTDKNLTCSVTSATIGTTAIAGNTYAWSPAAGLSSTTIAQPVANPTSTTTYTVTVTGTNGCTATDAVVVNVNTVPPTVDAGVDKNLTCTTTSATIGTASIAGNSYSWSPATGLSSTTIAQPVANPTVTTTYTVTVTGANGCTATDIVVVNVNTTPPTVDAGVDKNLTCTTTSATIGTAAIAGNTYVWSPATSLSSTTIAQPVASPSVTTTYTVTVTGTNGCTSTDAVIVNVNTTPPTVNAGVDKNLTCSTTSTTIGTTAIVGNTYVWSPALGLSSTTIAQPTANPTVTTTYTVTVTGSNGCTATDAVIVNVNTTPPSVDAGGDKFLTCSTTSATIGTTAIAGNTYSWSPATALSSTTIAQPVANPTVTTTYTVTVTGTNGCTATDVVVVNVNTTPPTVDAGTDKFLTCTTTSSLIGTTAIVGNSYSWSPATGLSSTTVAQPTANPTVTTTYTVTVTGTNGCTATDVVVVNVNTTPPTVDAGSDKFLTCTTTSTTIGTASVIGNTYSWSPATGLSSTSVAQPTANPTVTTTYTVTVTGTNGCTSTDVVVVNVNTTPPTVDAGADKFLTCTTTSATIGSTAIVGNTYAWSPATGLSATNIAQPVANPTVTTTYTVTVTGTNGCTATDVVLVNVNTTPPTVDAGPDKFLTCSTTSASIGTAAISGSTYSWSPATGLSATNIAQPVANPTVTTTYTVTVTGINGCTSTDAVVVNVNTTPPTVDAGTDKFLTCTTTSTTIGTTTIAGNTYLWSPATALSSTTIAQPVANPTVTTSYTVTVTGTNGCTATDVVVVNVNTTPPTVDAGTDKNLTCAVPSATIGTTAIAGVSYSWNPATGLNSSLIAQPIASPVVTTSYTVTATGTNGCTATDVVVVNVNNTIPTITISGTPEVCNGSTASMTATSNIGTITWSNGSSAATQNLTAGTYTVTANNSGCISTTTVVVTVREGSVGNYVWTDLNADGINNEAASAGINGVTVQLYNLGVDLIQGTSDDQLIGTTVTANNAGNPGYYKFIVCTDGAYYVKFPLSTNANDTLTSQTATPATDNNSDANLLTGNSPVFNIVTNGVGIAKDNNTIDAGYVQSLSLGNLVWNDLNKNGLKDATELGLAGATVNLYLDANNDGLPDGGTVIATTTTNTNGLYVFNDLNPGNYIIGVIPPTPAVGSPFISSIAGQELNPNLNVDNNDNGITTTAGITYSGTITLLGGTEPLGETPNNGTSPDASSNLTVDFAFYQPANIYGNVFNDINGPTNVDGTGIGLPGGTQLYATLVNPSGIVVAVVPVNPNGTYSFLDVTPFTTYTMVISSTAGIVGNPTPAITLPTGWSNVSEDCCDNTGNDGTTNGSTTVVVGISDVFNVNFGIREPLSLGNAVWNDQNKNGIKDSGEPGIGGATVNLYEDANNDGVADGAALTSTTTDPNGNYIFNGLNPGNYIIGVVPPAAVGGTYTSSTTGQELNPNLNIDNNDNGITTNGGETISGTVTLSAGTEPTGELPNNASAPDVNANLTVDFGFFICPNNFTFNPVFICASTTLNLTTLEPTGFTGGVWTDNNGLIVASTNVGPGTYNYTYTNGTCSATGTVTVSLNIPDYTPTITIAPSAITGISNVRVIIQISEILNRPSCSDVYIFVPRLEPRYTFTYNATATTMGGVAVSNADWQYFTSNPNFYVWKYIGGTTFPAGGSSKLGWIGSYDPNSTDGATTFSVQIYQGSGGETNITNNTDSENLIYFR